MGCLKKIKREGVIEEASFYFFAMAMNLSMGMAGRLIICMVPRDPSSTETRVIVSLSGASTMFTKS